MSNNRSPNEELEEFREWDIEFRSNYRGPCVLKDIDPATTCNYRSWNHIIGEKFLSEIAPKGKVLYWDIFSGKMLGIQSMVKGKLGRKLVHEITDFKPVLIGIVNDPRCQIKGACNYHDNQAFRLIETPSLFDAKNRQHQATIGMRAAFAETAFLSNSEQWLSSKHRGKPKPIYLEYLRIKNSLSHSLTRLRGWISTVRRNAPEELETVYWTERLPITIAACGTSIRDGIYSAPTINVMPRTDGETDILISTRHNDTKELNDRDAAEIERLTNIIKSVKSDPATGIEMLIRTMDQVFLNPEEYNDNSVITEEGRTSLRNGIASYRAEESLRMNQESGISFRRRQQQRPYT